MVWAQPLTYLDEYDSLVENTPYSSEYDMTTHYITALQNVGNILAISDPSNAYIYIDGVLQPRLTSVLLTNIPIGNHTVLFSKVGYAPYIEIASIKKNVTTKVATILTQIASIVDKGIVICATSNISNCPIIPIACPISVTPLDYTNLIAILNSTSPITITARFTYTINGVINNKDVNTNLLTGTNIIYAFPTNIQYSANTILSLEDVTLIS